VAARPAPLCLLTIHAHPDDEASKGSATVARYAAEGVRTVLVCCTGGEAGQVLNGAMDTPEVRANLASIRAAELEASVAAIGYSKLHRLGYHDSGMPGTDWNRRPDNFHNAPLDEAVGKLVQIIRAERPQVIVTYPDDRPFRGHPDHIRVLEISGPAFDAAGDPRQFPEAGGPWQPLKMYCILRQSKARREALDPLYHALGSEEQRREEESRRQSRSDREEGVVTTMVQVGDFLGKRRAALLAHRSQIPPDNRSLRLPDDVLSRVYPWDDYQLVRCLVETNTPEGEMEDDLFAGLRNLD